MLGLGPNSAEAVRLKCSLQPRASLRVKLAGGCAPGYSITMSCFLTQGWGRVEEVADCALEWATADSYLKARAQGYSGPGEGWLMSELRVVRTATVNWLTRPPKGVARVTVGSSAFPALPFSLVPDEAERDATTPGELLTATHCSALAMYLARILEREELRAQELIIEGSYAFAGDWFEIEAVSLTVLARVDGAGDDALERKAREAVERCGESLGLPAGDAVELRTKLL